MERRDLNGGRHELAVGGMATASSRSPQARAVSSTHLAPIARASGSSQPGLPCASADTGGSPSAESLASPAVVWYTARSAVAHPTPDRLGFPQGEGDRDLPPRRGPCLSCWRGVPGSQMCSTTSLTGKQAGNERDHCTVLRSVVPWERARSRSTDPPRSVRVTAGAREA
jgi:hypothetical protein